MSKRGENTYKRRDGRWEGRFLKSLTPQNKRQYGYVYAKSYREAKEKLAAAKSRNPASGNIDKNFEFYCRQWLELSANKIKQSSYSKYRNIINNHIIPALGGCAIIDINYIMIEKMSYDLFEKGCTRMRNRQCAFSHIATYLCYPMRRNRF